MNEPSLHLKWVFGKCNTDVHFISENEIVFGCGSCLKTCRTDVNEETAIEALAVGIQCITTDLNQPLIAVSDLCQQTSIYVIEFSSFKILSQLKCNVYCEYSSLNFARKNFIFAVEAYPNYVVTLYNWKERQQLKEISYLLHSPPTFSTKFTVHPAHDENSFFQQGIALHFFEIEDLFQDVELKTHTVFMPKIGDIYGLSTLTFEEARNLTWFDEILHDSWGIHSKTMHDLTLHSLCEEMSDIELVQFLDELSKQERLVISCHCWLPDKDIIIACTNGSVLIYSFEGVFKKYLKFSDEKAEHLNFEDIITCMALSSVGLFIAMQNGDILLVTDLDQWNPSKKCSFPNEALSIKFSPNFFEFILVTDNGSVWLGNIDFLEELLCLVPEISDDIPVVGICILENSYIVRAKENGLIEALDIDNRRQLLSVLDIGENIKVMELSLGSIIFAATTEGNLFVLNVIDLKNVHIIQELRLCDEPIEQICVETFGNKEEFRVVTCSSEEDFVLVANNFGFIKCYNISHLKPENGKSWIDNYQQEKLNKNNHLSEKESLVSHNNSTSWLTSMTNKLNYDILRSIETEAEKFSSDILKFGKVLKYLVNENKKIPPKHQNAIEDFILDETLRKSLLIERDQILKDYEYRLRQKLSSFLKDISGMEKEFFIEMIDTCKFIKPLKIGQVLYNYSVLKLSEVDIERINYAFKMIQINKCVDGLIAERVLKNYSERLHFDENYEDEGDIGNIIDCLKKDIFLLQSQEEKLNYTFILQYIVFRKKIAFNKSFKQLLNFKTETLASMKAIRDKILEIQTQIEDEQEIWVPEEESSDSYFQVTEQEIERNCSNKPEGDSTELKGFADNFLKTEWFFKLSNPETKGNHDKLKPDVLKKLQKELSKLIKNYNQIIEEYDRWHNALVENKLERDVQIMLDELQIFLLCLGDHNKSLLNKLKLSHQSRIHELSVLISNTGKQILKVEDELEKSISISKDIFSKINESNKVVEYLSKVSRDKTAFLEEFKRRLDLNTTLEVPITLAIEYSQLEMQYPDNLNFMNTLFIKRFHLESLNQLLSDVGSVKLDLVQKQAKYEFQIKKNTAGVRKAILDLKNLEDDMETVRTLPMGKELQNLLQDPESGLIPGTKIQALEKSASQELAEIERQMKQVDENASRIRQKMGNLRRGMRRRLEEIEALKGNLEELRKLGDEK
ncbi:hypothetical protein JTE90_006540 [Oedothorax gibbosus]|uniref:Cilia- and flagella-associated protein 43 n=1 Tax=Oedothorax gibbosus TaxID=931172 RepID=A0AAV6VJG4_9ARAC|nr:hypothetical protein JTE90_006540 [Oedothorax gibbosus]